MKIDLTNIMEKTPEQVIALAHKYTAVPSLIIYFIISSVVLFFIGIAFVKESRARFIVMWIFFIIIMAIILSILIFCPSLIQWIADIFVKQN